VIALLLGLQQGFKKYCCFICEWDSRARSLHYSRKNWASRNSLEPGIINVDNQPLVEPSKILLPSMHLKLGLMKNFVKAMNQEEAADFTYLWEKFPRLSEAKLKEGVLIGPQIRDLIKDEFFNTLLQGDEKLAWDSFKFVVKGFLGYRRAENYEELVSNLLQSYQNLGCNVSEKIHFLHSHLDFPRELWCSGWWTWRTFRSTHFFNGEEISSKMELCYARRLLLGFGKGCPYRGMQATGKTEKNSWFWLC